jgi:flavonoid 3'-monooxygenase
MKKLHRRFDDMMNRIIAHKKAAGVRTASEGSKEKDLLSVLLAMMQDDARAFTGSEEDRITETDAKALILVRCSRFATHTG